MKKVWWKSFLAVFRSQLFRKKINVICNVFHDHFHLVQPNYYTIFLFESVQITNLVIFERHSTSNIFLGKIFQNGLFKIIVRHTSDCDLTENLLLQALQWFETFKQFYTCVVDHKEPDQNAQVKIKPFDHRKTQTFLLNSITPEQCKARHTEC